MKLLWSEATSDRVKGAKSTTDGSSTCVLRKLNRRIPVQTRSCELLDGRTVTADRLWARVTETVEKKSSSSSSRHDIDGERVKRDRRQLIVVIGKENNELTIDLRCPVGGMTANRRVVSLCVPQQAALVVLRMKPSQRNRVQTSMRRAIRPTAGGTTVIRRDNWDQPAVCSLCSIFSGRRQRLDERSTTRIAGGPKGRSVEEFMSGSQSHSIDGGASAVHPGDLEQGLSDEGETGVTMKPSFYVV